MEREKIGRKRRGIAVLTLAALFFWYLPQIQVSRQIRKEQEEAVEMYVREEKEENKEENEKSEEVQEQEPGSTDKNLFRTIDFAGLRSKNREICAWLWIPGCALDVPVAHGQDNAYYLTHDAFCRFTAVFLHRVIHRRIFLNVTRFYMGIICGMERCSED